MPPKPSSRFRGRDLGYKLGVMDKNEAAYPGFRALYAALYTTVESKSELCKKKAYIAGERFRADKFKGWEIGVEC